jgi:hypothetical protein
VKECLGWLTAFRQRPQPSELVFQVGQTRLCVEFQGSHKRERAIFMTCRCFKKEYRERRVLALDQEAGAGRCQLKGGMGEVRLDGYI